MQMIVGVPSPWEHIPTIQYILEYISRTYMSNTLTSNATLGLDGHSWNIPGSLLATRRREAYGGLSGASMGSCPG